MPSVSRGEEFGAGAEDAVGEARRVGELAAPRADAEIGGLQLERDGAAGELGLLQPPRHLLGERAQDRLEPPAVGDVGFERRLGADALRLAARIDRARVVGARESCASRSPIEP